MLYYLIGDDFTRIEKRLLAILKSTDVAAKEVVRFSEITSTDVLLPYLEENLFGSTLAIILRAGKELPQDIQFFLANQLETMEHSSNTFVIISGEESKEISKVAIKMGKKSEELKLTTPKNEANVFAVTDAWSSGDKRGAWLSFHDALRRGAAPEEVHGALVWAVRTMALVKNPKLGGSAESLGLKPYSFQKARNNGEGFTTEGLQKTYCELVNMLENVRIKGGDLGISLELFLLQSV